MFFFHGSPLLHSIFNLFDAACENYYLHVFSLVIFDPVMCYMRTCVCGRNEKCAAMRNVFENALQRDGETHYSSGSSKQQQPQQQQQPSTHTQTFT